MQNSETDDQVECLRFERKVAARRGVHVLRRDGADHGTSQSLRWLDDRERTQAIRHREKLVTECTAKSKRTSERSRGKVPIPKPLIESAKAVPVLLAPNMRILNAGSVERGVSLALISKPLLEFCRAEGVTPQLGSREVSILELLPCNHGRSVSALGAARGLVTWMNIDTPMTRAATGE